GLNKLYLVPLIGMLMVSNIRAQEGSGVSNSNDAVETEDIINSDIGMPVASNDGQYVLVKFYHYSCCYDDGAFLRLYNGDKKVRTIQTAPAEDIEWSDAVFDSVKIKIRQLVGARSYYAMTSVPTYEIKDSGEAWSIDLVIGSKTHQSKPFKIDSIRYGDSSCCLGGMIEEEQPCKMVPDIQNIWIDKSKNMMLLEYGVVSGLNGCDRGPFFKTVALTKDY
ncbi:MAG: hypothetical protein AAGA66_06405, partial [Bacteroidota bacterium]